MKKIDEKNRKKNRKKWEKWEKMGGKGKKWGKSEQVGKKRKKNKMSPRKRLRELLSTATYTVANTKTIYKRHSALLLSSCSKLAGTARNYLRASRGLESDFPREAGFLCETKASSLEDRPRNRRLVSEMRGDAEGAPTLPTKGDNLVKTVSQHSCNEQSLDGSSARNTVIVIEIEIEIEIERDRTNTAITTYERGQALMKRQSRNVG